MKLSIKSINIFTQLISQGTPALAAKFLEKCGMSKKDAESYTLIYLLPLCLNY